MTTKEYNPKEIEKKWQQKWKESKLYQPDIKSAKKPFYNLMMYPYPSAEGLHVGNMYAFSGADIYGRYQRMQGYDVFEPIGLDGFGIHSENYAIKIGKHPMEHAKTSEENFYRQLSIIGNGYAWDQRLETYDPDYYKWTQWLFIQMFKSGLAYKGKASVNWCPSCKTVLADEQVIAGTCERCGTEVERREMSSWYFKITDYADRLLTNIDGEGNSESTSESKKTGPVTSDYDVKRYGLRWPEKIKIAQRNWIGRSEGAIIKFPLKDGDEKIPVFTTRADTIFGVTFLVVAPEYAKSLMEMVPRESKKEVEEYIKTSLNKSEQERKAEEKEKSGVETGVVAINPVNGKEIPVFVADYVLMEYGTGAVMGVPGHDLRDYEFAGKYNLPIIRVIVKENVPARSYLMGGREITDGELTKMGINIKETTESGSRLLEIPADSLKEYEDLIVKKMEPGFWNEYIANEIVFIFKFKDGKVERIVLDNKSEQKINRLAAEFLGEDANKTNVWTWLAQNQWYTPHLIHAEYGKSTVSGDYSGLTSREAARRIISDLKKKGLARQEVNYHLRDWLISRQRYWGPPIPMIFCQECADKGISWFDTPQGRDFKGLTLEEDHKKDLIGWFPVEEDKLPVILPEIEDYKPKGDGSSPLANAPREWKEAKCPHCGGKAVRELDVSDTFLDSSWYFLRYPSVGLNQARSVPFEKEVTQKWLPVDAYIGGAEHAVLHLLYSRFVTMVLHDLKHLTFEEPFPFLFGHGLLIKDGAKISKSKGNIVNPDEYINKYGADALRAYLMFMGPFSQGGDFRDTGMEGMHRFIKRLWKLFDRHHKNQLNLEAEREVKVKLHKTIKKVGEDCASFRFNTAISSIMELVNTMEDHMDDKGETLQASSVWDQAINSLALLIAPFAPFLAEEAWVNRLGNEYSVHTHPWPEYDTELIREEMVTIPVQVNGKLRSQLTVEQSLSTVESEIVDKALADSRIVRWLNGKKPERTIFVPGKLLNFVIK